MSTANARARDERDERLEDDVHRSHNQGPYRLTPEEADWLEECEREADEDEKAGTLIPIKDVLARLGSP